MKDVYTLDDLVSREVLDAGAELPARLAVIGRPIAHSASPGMHQAALDALGISARYIRVEVAEEDLPECVKRMAELGFIGANITVPHKFAVMGVCSVIDPAARALGAVNTLRFDANGIQGFNTDAPGFRRAVEEVRGSSLAGASVLIVGAGGGAGQALAMSCALAGVSRLVLVNRTVEKLAVLEARIRAHVAGDYDILLLGMDSAELVEAARSCDIIVQTTSLGLKQGEPSVLASECLRSGQMVYDTIYLPTVTPLLALAREQGCQTANGLSMLLHQGVLAFQIWFPGTAPMAAMRRGLGITLP